MTGIERIGASLRELIRERKIVARCELLHRTYEYVRQAGLSDAEKEELKGHVGERIAPGIFQNVLGGETIFFDLPKLDTYTTLGGRLFHFVHTEKYSRQDFDNALRKFMAVQPELRDLVIRNLSGMLKEFMAGAGYSLEADEGERLLFEADGRKVEADVVGSINALKLGKLSPAEGLDLVVLVPSAEGAEPFVQFYREHGEEAEEMGVQVWVANMEKGTIDPFIGYTTDMDIYNQFKNPRLAETIRSTWGKKG